MVVVEDEGFERRGREEEEGSCGGRVEVEERGDEFWERKAGGKDY